MAVSMIAMVGLGGFGVYAMTQKWQQRHALEQTEQAFHLARDQQEKQLADLRAKLAAEVKKNGVFARNIGQIEARLSRLDSLGQRLVEVASLSKNEFDFGVKPAFGGPRQVVNDAGARSMLDIGKNLQSMDVQMSRLDTQLAAIDYLLQDKKEEVAARPHAWPTEGGWLSSPYGLRSDPFTGEPEEHRGVDIANRFGAPVLAAGRGIVVFAGKTPDFGNMIMIDHGFGYKTRYGHMSSLDVKVGDMVQANQLIGRVGSSGRSTGPHLHFEVYRYGMHLDPAGFLPPRHG
ncbi:MAG TPA: M23 family metallopeptidase [Mariprofundaceae bacterium]|nr:M23 family metallopeptidase [Mariprofundaceae bacterium]